MKYDVLYNFISPVTGRIKVDQGYIVVGDKDNIGMPSPILIDIRQDIIDLRRKIGSFEELNKLDHNRIWIGDYNNEPVEQLHIGIINLPPLEEAVFPNPISPITGDFRIPNPTFDYLSPFDWVMSGPFLPQIYATKYDTLGNPTGTDVSSSLAMTQVRAAQIMKRFDNANFIVGSSTVDFTWENPKMYLIPEPLKQLYGLGTTYTFTKAQSLGALETGLLKNTVNNGAGTLSKAISGKDYVDVAAPIANMQLALIRPLVQDAQGNDISKLVSRIDQLPIDNLTNLASGKVWQGGINNRPVELTLSEAGIAGKNATYILQSPDSNLPNSKALNDIGYGLLKNSLFTGLTIASGGATPIANDYVTPTNLQTAIATLTGEVEASFWSNVGISVGASSITGIFSTLISSAYGEYLFSNKYKPLLCENKYDETDEIPQWGKGNVWFDNNRLSSDPTLKNYRPGIRAISWDSSKLFDSDLVPVSIGVFGYKWSIFNRSHGQEGFVWEAEMENNSSHQNYRLPKKFSLRHVGHSHPGIGWNEKDIELMNYDYYQGEFNLHRDTNFTSKGAIKIPVGNTAERPSNPSVGMIRYNTDL